MSSNGYRTIVTDVNFPTPEDFGREITGGRTPAPVIIDLDGTVRRSKSNPKGFIKGADDIELFPDVEAELWKWRMQNYVIIGVTNQGGVAYGFKSSEQAMEENTRTQDLFTKNPFHTILTAFTHPNGNVFPYNMHSLLRKPAYGLLALAEVQFSNFGLFIDWPRGFVVGDSRDDIGLAESIGVPFHHAEDFFHRK